MSVEQDLQNAVVAINDLHTVVQTNLNTLTSATNTAVTSANSASNSAIASANSASQSANSANAAANSATQAANSATAAANSATAAANSATQAANAAVQAANSATQAANSATNAANSASQALGSAVQAANSATNAANSAVQAANSATQAANSATQAANSFIQAANSATAAANSAAQAANSAANAASIALTTLLSVANVATLRTTTVSTTRDVNLGGYYADGDGGGGEFYGVTGAAAGTYVDNGGTIIVPTGGDGSAAWIRVSEPFVDVKWFGARGDAKSVTGNVSITSGNNVLTVTGAGFTAADVGKAISVPAALGTIQANSAQKPSLNTGTGTMSAVTTSAGVVAGNYTVTFTSATAFTVTNPSGTTVGTGSVGSPFSTQVGFTITAGGTAFVAGDAFIINVFFNSLITTISEYISATQVILAANAGATLSASSRVVTWGTENTTPFTKAIASLSKTGAKLIIPAGVYLTSARPLYFLDMSNFVVDGYGATIKYMDGITPADGTRIIEARRCTNFTINGLVLDGNRANRPSVLQGFLFSMQKCINFTLNNVGAINGTIDGYYIAGEPGQSTDPTSYSENFLMNNCYADNNARQGMSIINANDYTITGGYFSRTNGSAPQAGIDVEANAPYPASLPSNARGRFYGVMFENNSGLGLLITSQGSTEDFIVEGCQFIDNQNGGANIGSNNTWVRNCVFRGNVNAANLQGALQTTKFVTLTNGGFTGNKFVNNTNTLADIYIAADTSNFIVDGNRSENSNKAGIISAGQSTTITNNTILNASVIGINSGSKSAVISGNKLSGCVGRGIYSAADNVRITNNSIFDCNPTGLSAYISAMGADVLVADNVMSATAQQATAIGVFAGASGSPTPRLILRNNVCQNLHTTDPYTIHSSVTSPSISGNVGGTANDNRVVREGFALPSLTTAARPAANTLAAGQQVFNTTTKKVNVSDGSTWYNVDSIVTNIAALRALPVTSGYDVEVSGYYTGGDGGSGRFYGVTGAAAGTYVDNGGTIIVPTGGNGSAAWLRILDGFVSAEMFGAVDDSTTDSTTFIQKAIDYALSAKLPLLLDGKFKITSSLIINRQANLTKDIFVIYADGAGNGIYCDTAITIFDSTLAPTYYDPTGINRRNPRSEFITFRGVHFEATASAAKTSAYVISDKFLRIRFENCNFRAIKCIAATTYLQTWYWDHCNIRGWENGYAISTTGGCFDVSITGCVVEESSSGGFVSLYDQEAVFFPRGVRIINNLIEGMTGTGIAISGARGCAIIGNYFEAVGWTSAVTSGVYNPVIKLNDTNQVALGLVIEANQIVMAPFNDNWWAIEWGNTQKAFSNNNYCEGNLHNNDDASVSSSAWGVSSMGDYTIRKLWKNGRGNILSSNIAQQLSTASSASAQFTGTITQAAGTSPDTLTVSGTFGTIALGSTLCDSTGKPYRHVGSDTNITIVSGPVSGVYTLSGKVDATFTGGTLSGTMYSTSFIIDAYKNGVYRFTCSNNTYNAISRPVAGVIGQEITVVVINAITGSAPASDLTGISFLGTGIWSLNSTWSALPTGYSRTLKFYYDGSTWREISRHDAGYPSVVIPYAVFKDTKSSSGAFTVNAYAYAIFKFTVTAAGTYSCAAASGGAGMLVGRRITIQIVNNTGADITAWTFTTNYTVNTWTPLANNRSRSIEFYYDGTNWVELYRSDNDKIVGIAALRALPVTSGYDVEVSGYYTGGDGGGGNFYGVTGAAAGTYVDNGGTIIVPTGGDGSAAWLRNFSGSVNARWFGAKGDGVTNDSAALQAAISTGLSVIIPAGIYLASNLKQSTNQQFIAGEGRCRIYKNANGPLLTCTGDFISFENIDFNGADLATGSVYSGSNVLCFPTAVASFTASMTGTGGTGTFTATGLTGSIATGNKIYGDGVPLNATVGSNVSGNTWNFTYDVKSIYKDPVSLTNIAMITSAAGDVSHVSFQNCSSRNAGFRALVSKGITKIYGTNVNGTWNTATTGAIFNGVIVADPAPGATQATLTVTPASGQTVIVGSINPGDQLSGTGIVGGAVVGVASGVTIVSQVTSTEPGGALGKGGTYLVSNNLSVSSIMMQTNVFNYDIEVGCPGFATLYHQLTNVYTSNNLGGIAFIDAGSPFLVGSEIGKLYLGKTTALSGQNAGVFCSNRITGDVTVELSNGMFLGNQFGTNVIYFGSGTSLCSLDRTNLGFLSTIINDGNSNNLIEVNTSTGGTADWRIGPSSSVANFKVHMGSGDLYLPGSAYYKNAKGVYIDNAAGTPQSAALLNASDNWFFGTNTGTNKYTVVNGGSSGVFQAVNGVSVTQAGVNYFRGATDNSIDLGTGSVRWKAVYAVNGTIQTSDERSKCEIRTLSDKETSIAAKLKSLIRMFKFKDAVEEKGDGARWHTGIIAQDVIKAFADEGLDAHRYGLLCYDEWDAKEAVVDDDGNIISPAIEAGNRYGVRYDELLAFIVSSI